MADSTTTVTLDVLDETKEWDEILADLRRAIEMLIAEEYQFDHGSADTGIDADGSKPQLRKLAAVLSDGIAAIEKDKGKTLALWAEMDREVA